MQQRIVIPGLDPGIHVVPLGGRFEKSANVNRAPETYTVHYRPDVDARVKPGHDDLFVRTGS
ncbi:hypothetical protein GCM10007301_44620 [Azorhizobium oxalatiphilum]|uniref:Uncharacterized protein n=1 Tax=Azorhizobium oxalatiphilum TaxID=980631 RepID=A0A917CAK1_9HYPH|nr:hypothetical protein GCM10007301_44620 [Azorhizobium oxalatiphilum]